MKTFKNIVRNFFIMSTIIGSAFSVSAQSSTRIYHDAEAFDLKGHVKECVSLSRVADFPYSFYEISTECFNTNGSWMPKSDNSTIYHNENNRIESYSDSTQYDDNEYSKNTTTFIWSNGKVREIDNYHYYNTLTNVSDSMFIKYEYNNDGLISTETSIINIYKKVTNYEYTKFDDFGNWIERIEYHNCISPDETTTSQSKVTRIISYYDSTNANSYTSISTQSRNKTYDDAKAYRLKGHVKECIYSSDTTCFKPNGELVDCDNYKAIRNHKGQLMHLSRKYTEYSTYDNSTDTIDYSETISFVWENDTVVSNGYSIYYCSSDYAHNNSMLNSYKFNDFGEINAIESIWNGVVIDYSIYSDYKYDDHGNWIERKVTTEYDGENKSVIETRTITYYE
ncbi:MAG: hypothetical protein IKJ52_04330 [Muribaculaceae bacterium]|nr:hypothetical protein [Muribaculaceae bacterium]